ncbi:MAG: hypothetical protein NTV25_00305 [Methanothrix sp.]|nr:hypothetical protein [Methanothrix sp.]
MAEAKPGSNILKAMASSRDGMIPTKKNRSRFDNFDNFMNLYNTIRFHELLDTKCYLQTSDMHFGPDCLRDAS